MHSFFSKVFGRKKEDKETSPTTLGAGELLDGKFEAVSPSVSPSATNFLELDQTKAKANVNEGKDKEIGFSLFRGKSRPSSPEVNQRKLDNLPHLSLNFRETKEELASRQLGFLQETDLDTQGLLSDAVIGQRRLNPLEALVLIQACSKAITARGLETLGIMHPHWYSSSPDVQRRLISRYIASLNSQNGEVASPSSLTSTNSLFESEIHFTRDPHDIAAVLRWGLRHLQIEGNSFGTDDGWYKAFLDAESAAEYPPKSFSEQLAPHLPAAHLDLLTATLEIFSSLAAHAEANSTSGSKLSKMFGLWLLTARRVEDKDDWASFYARWERTGRMLEHIFLARIRDESVDQRMPVRLLELVRKYPYTQGLSSPTTDLQLLPRPRFSTPAFDALFVRIEVEFAKASLKPKAKMHPLNLLADAFSTKVAEGEFAELWTKITAASKDGSNPSPLSNIFADETIRFLSIIPDARFAKSADARSPTFTLLPTSPVKKAFSEGDEGQPSTLTSVHKKVVSEPASPPPISATVVNDIGSDWAQFSSSGFLDSTPAIVPLVSTLFDSDIEKTVPPTSAVSLSRKSSRRMKGSRKSIEVPRLSIPDTAMQATPQADAPAQEKKPVVKASKLAIIQFDEAFIDFWSDSLLDPLTSTWPTFIICKFKSTLVPSLVYGPIADGQSQKTLKWMILEQVYTVKPPPTPPPVPVISPVVVPTSPPETARPASPSQSVSGKKRFNFWNVSRTGSNSSVNSQKGKKRDVSPKVGEMGELVEEDVKEVKPASSTSKGKKPEEQKPAAVEPPQPRSEAPVIDSKGLEDHAQVAVVATAAAVVTATVVSAVPSTEIKGDSEEQEAEEAAVIAPTSELTTEDVTPVPEDATAITEEGHVAKQIAPESKLSAEEEVAFTREADVQDISSVPAPDPTIDSAPVVEVENPDVVEPAVVDRNSAVVVVDEDLVPKDEIKIEEPIDHTVSESNVEIVVPTEVQNVAFEEEVPLKEEIPVVALPPTDEPVVDATPAFVEAASPSDIPSEPDVPIVEEVVAENTVGLLPEPDHAVENTSSADVEDKDDLEEIPQNGQTEEPDPPSSVHHTDLPLAKLEHKALFEAPITTETAPSFTAPAVAAEVSSDKEIEVEDTHIALADSAAVDSNMQVVETAEATTHVPDTAEVADTLPETEVENSAPTSAIELAGDAVTQLTTENISSQEATPASVETFSAEEDAAPAAGVEATVDPSTPVDTIAGLTATILPAENADVPEAAPAPATALVAEIALTAPPAELATIEEPASTPEPGAFVDSETIGDSMEQSVVVAATEELTQTTVLEALAEPLITEEDSTQTLAAEAISVENNNSSADRETAEDVPSEPESDKEVFNATDTVAVQNILLDEGEVSVPESNFVIAEVIANTEDIESLLPIPIPPVDLNEAAESEVAQAPEVEHIPEVLKHLEPSSQDDPSEPSLVSNSTETDIEPEVLLRDDNNLPEPTAAFSQNVTEGVKSEAVEAPSVECVKPQDDIIHENAAADKPAPPADLSTGVDSLPPTEAPAEEVRSIDFTTLTNVSTAEDTTTEAVGAEHISITPHLESVVVPDSVPVNAAAEQVSSSDSNVEIALATPEDGVASTLLPEIYPLPTDVNEGTAGQLPDTSTEAIEHGEATTLKPPEILTSEGTSEGPSTADAGPDSNHRVPTASLISNIEHEFVPLTTDARVASASASDEAPAFDESQVGRQDLPPAIELAATASFAEEPTSSSEEIDVLVAPADTAVDKPDNESIEKEDSNAGSQDVAQDDEVHVTGQLGISDIEVLDELPSTAADARTSIVETPADVSEEASSHVLAETSVSFDSLLGLETTCPSMTEDLAIEEHENAASIEHENTPNSSEDTVKTELVTSATSFETQPDSVAPVASTPAASDSDIHEPLLLPVDEELLPSVEPIACDDYSETVSEEEHVPVNIAGVSINIEENPAEDIVVEAASVPTINQENGALDIVEDPTDSNQSKEILIASENRTFTNYIVEVPLQPVETHVDDPVNHRAVASEQSQTIHDKEDKQELDALSTHSDIEATLVNASNNDGEGVPSHTTPANEEDILLIAPQDKVQDAELPASLDAVTPTPCASVDAEAVPHDETSVDEVFGSPNEQPNQTAEEDLGTSSFTANVHTIDNNDSKSVPSPDQESVLVNEAPVAEVPDTVTSAEMTLDQELLHSATGPPTISIADSVETVESTVGLDEPVVADQESVEDTRNISVSTSEPNKEKEDSLEFFESTPSDISAVEVPNLNSEHVSQNALDNSGVLSVEHEDATPSESAIVVKSPPVQTIPGLEVHGDLRENRENPVDDELSRETQDPLGTIEGPATFEPEIFDVEGPSFTREEEVTALALPASGASVVDDTTVEEPVEEQEIVEIPIVEDLAVVSDLKEPVGQQSNTATTEETYVDEGNMEHSVDEEHNAERSSIEIPVIVPADSATEDPVAEEKTADEPVKQSPIVELTTEEPGGEVFELPPAELSVAKGPAVEATTDNIEASGEARERIGTVESDAEEHIDEGPVAQGAAIEQPAVEETTQIDPALELVLGQSETSFIGEHTVEHHVEDPEVVHSVAEPTHSVELNEDEATLPAASNASEDTQATSANVTVQSASYPPLTVVHQTGPVPNVQPTSYPALLSVEEHVPVPSDTTDVFHETLQEDHEVHNSTIFVDQQSSAPSISEEEQTREALQDPSVVEKNSIEVPKEEPVFAHEEVVEHLAIVQEIHAQDGQEPSETIDAPTTQGIDIDIESPAEEMSVEVPDTFTNDEFTAATNVLTSEVEVLSSVAEKTTAEGPIILQFSPDVDAIPESVSTTVVDSSTNVKEPPIETTLIEDLSTNQPTTDDKPPAESAVDSTIQDAPAVSDAVATNSTTSPASEENPNTADVHSDDIALSVVPSDVTASEPATTEEAPVTLVPSEDEASAPEPVEEVIQDAVEPSLDTSSAPTLEQTSLDQSLADASLVPVNEQIHEKPPVDHEEAVAVAQEIQADDIDSHDTVEGLLLAGHGDSSDTPAIASEDIVPPAFEEPPTEEVPVVAEAPIVENCLTNETLSNTPPSDTISAVGEASPLVIEEQPPAEVPLTEEYTAEASPAGLEQHISSQDPAVGELVPSVSLGPSDSIAQEEPTALIETGDEVAEVTEVVDDSNAEEAEISNVNGDGSSAWQHSTTDIPKIEIPDIIHRSVSENIGSSILSPWSDDNTQVGGTLSPVSPSTLVDENLSTDLTSKIKSLVVEDVGKEGHEVDTVGETSKELELLTATTETTSAPIITQEDSTHQ